MCPKNAYQNSQTNNSPGLTEYAFVIQVSNSKEDTRYCEVIILRWDIHFTKLDSVLGSQCPTFENLWPGLTMKFILLFRQISCAPSFCLPGESWQFDCGSKRAACGRNVHPLLFADWLELEVGNNLQPANRKGFGKSAIVSVILRQTQNTELLRLSSKLRSYGDIIWTEIK